MMTQRPHGREATVSPGRRATLAELLHGAGTAARRAAAPVETRPMTALMRLMPWAVGLACLAVVTAAHALCTEGKIVSCSIGGQAGTKECLGGHWGPCEIAPEPDPDPPPPPPPPPIGSFVRITDNSPESINLFIRAVGTPNTLVLLAHDLDLDLTGYENIPIVTGVTLTSEAPPLGHAPPTIAAAPGPGFPLPDYTVARDAHHLGPRVYTRSRPLPLFLVRCNGVDIFGDNVRIVGFRLQGPHFETEEGDDNLERGLMIDSCTGIEIANMELAGWSGQAIYVQDEDHLQRISHPDDVNIHDNFFHHNQHKGGNGYGVAVQHGAYARIERNVFDFNRHAIAASGDAGTGYVAHQNLVLKGGGKHDKWYNEYTHQFDVHGDQNCPDVPIKDDSTWNCGHAGEAFEFTQNAFQYTNDHAIKVRGNPRVGALVARNVFAHDSEEDAIAQGDGGGYGDNITHPLEIKGNTFGVDPYGHYGVCDVDGDGMDDLFLATGVSWWYASGGRMHWVYLQAQDARLDTVGLGDFDGDGRCDVFAVHVNDFMISSRGTGEWHSLGTFAMPFDQLGFGDFNGDGITDMFRRAPDGQWWAISPGRYDWTALQSSSFPLRDLRFGDFNNDRVTDVLAVQGGQWSVSLGGTTPWQPLNPTLADRLEGLLMADINADGRDDILRYTPADHGITGTWEISWGGSTAWEPLATLAWVDTPEAREQRPADDVRSLVGRFSDTTDWAAYDVLALDHERKGHLYSDRYGFFVPHSLYAY
jgi:hypothetical protein